MSSRGACLPVRSGGDEEQLAKFDSDVVRGQSHDEFIIWSIETIAWSPCSLNIRVLCLYGVCVDRGSFIKIAFYFRTIYMLEVRW